MVWLASQPLLASFTSESHLALELPSEMCWRDSKSCTRLAKSFQEQQQHSSPRQGPARLEGWANSNLVKFKEDQCKLLDLWRKNPARVEAGGGWAGEKLCGRNSAGSLGHQELVDTGHGPSMHLGIGLTLSAPPSGGHGPIQCLVLGLPQYRMWTSWCMRGPQAGQSWSSSLWGEVEEWLSQSGAEMAPGGLEKSDLVSSQQQNNNADFAVMYSISHKTAH